MAREIQPTPVLEGQEALDFLNKLDNYKDYLGRHKIEKTINTII